jgi:hypothetical protein
MWSEVELGVGLRRDIELRGDIWSRLLAKGADMFQYNDSTGMAETIVGMLAAAPDSVVLKLQRELLDEGKLLSNTSAGSLVRAGIQEQREVSKGYRLILKEQLAAAIESNDIASHRKINRLLQDQGRSYGHSADDLLSLRQNIVSETELRIKEIEKEQKSKMIMWSKALSRIQKFAKVLSPSMTVTLTILPTVSLAVKMG